MGRAWCSSSSLISHWLAPAARNVGCQVLCPGGDADVGPGIPGLSGVGVTRACIWSLKWQLSSIFRSEFLGHWSLTVLSSLINPSSPYTSLNLTQNTHKKHPCFQTPLTGCCCLPGSMSHLSSQTGPKFTMLRKPVITPSSVASLLCGLKRGQAIYSHWVIPKMSWGNRMSFQLPLALPQCSLDWAWAKKQGSGYLHVLDKGREPMSLDLAHLPDNGLICQAQGLADTPPPAIWALVPWLKVILLGQIIIFHLIF